MYCPECGKQNPDNAKFCMSCGTRMAEPESAPVNPVKIEPPKSVKVDPAKPASIEPPFKVQPIDPHSAYRRPGVRSDAPASSAEPPKPEHQPPSAANRAQLPPQRTVKAVTSSGGEVMPPSRAPNVKQPNRYKNVTHRAPAPSPYKRQEQVRRDPDDDGLFFEDIDEPDVLIDEEDLFARHIKSMIAVVLLALAVGTIGWLFFIPSGQLFRASIGVNAPAESYKLLGDQRTAAGELGAAADAYYEALKLDPVNYLYAMKVGEAYEKIGDDDTAFRAYQSCIEIRGNLPDPYLKLIEILKRAGNLANAEQWRKLGYDKTGDVSLAKPIETPRPQTDIIDSMPTLG